MKKHVMRMSAVGLLGAAIGLGVSLPARAEMDHKHEAKLKGDMCEKHCNAMQLRGEVESLEKELKQAQASGGKLIEVENKKEQVRKHIAQHQAELNDLQARLNGKSMGTSGKETKAMYYCPMHPNQKSDKPAKCSECGMNMEKMK